VKWYTGQPLRFSKPGIGKGGHHMSLYTAYTGGAAFARARGARHSAVLAA
jgi:hypothetical protein